MIPWALNTFWVKAEQSIARRVVPDLLPAIGDVDMGRQGERGAFPDRVVDEEFTVLINGQWLGWVCWPPARFWWRWS